MVKKRDLLKRIENLESANKTLTTLLTEMNEKVTYLWKQDEYKQEDLSSILNEWINGEEKGGENK